MVGDFGHHNPVPGSKVFFFLMWRKNSLGLLYRTPAHGNNQPESGMASFLEIISRSYDMALDRWTGEDWFGRLKPKKNWFWAMARCCWAHLVLQVRSFGPQQNIGFGGLSQPATQVGYKDAPFRPTSSFHLARLGGEWALLVQRSARYHIISFRLVGRVKLPHRAPPRVST